MIQARTDNNEEDDNGGGTTSSSAAASASSKNNNNNNHHDPKQALNDRLERLIRGDTVMLFMKGNPNKPQCGFSRQAIELLNDNEVPFGSFDILSDEDVRQELKVYSDWPTYPQIVRIYYDVTNSVCANSSSCW